MASNRLVLRSTPSPYNFPLSDIVKGSVLSWNEVDNNFIFLKGLNIQSGVVNGTDLVLNRINGTNISIDLSAFTGGTGTDTFVTGGTYNSSASTITFTNNTGGTFTVTGISGGTGTDYYTTGFTFNPANYDLTVSLNNGNNLTQNLGILAGDLKVTGGTYNPANGIATFINNSGGTFQVTGFLTGYTDVYTTGVTLNGNTIEFDRTDTPNAYSVDLSPILSGFSGTDVFVTGGTYSSSASTITFTNNTGGTFTVTGISGGTSGGTVSPAGSDTFIQFNDGGSFGANSGLTYDNTFNNFFTETTIGTKTTTLTNGITNLLGQSLSGASGIGYNNSLSGASAFTGAFVGDFTDAGGDDNTAFIGYFDTSTFNSSFARINPEGIELSNRDPLAYEADLVISPENNVVSLRYDDNILNTSSYLSLNPDGINMYHVTGGTSTGFFINNNYGINANLFNTGQTQSFTVTREIAPSVYQNYLSVDTNGYVRINNLYTFPNVDGSPNQVLQTDGGGNVSWATVSGGSGTDVFVTGGTYNQSNGIATFTNNSGGTFSLTGFTTGCSCTDYYTTGFTFNPANYDLTVSLNNGNDLTQNLGILAGDLKVTGGTYNPANGVGTFTNNSGGTFQVTGFLTGYTDTYTISAGLNGNTIEFDRTDTPNAYSVDLSPILSGFSGTDTFVTGGTYSSSASTITFTNNTGGTFTVTGISGFTCDTIYTQTDNYVSGVTQTINHNFNSTDVIVQIIYNNELIYGVVDNYQLNSVDVTFTSNLSNVKVIVISSGCVGGSGGTGTNSSIYYLSHGDTTPKNLPSSSLFIGNLPQLSAATASGDDRRIISQYTGQVTEVSIGRIITGVIGSGENNTYQINNVTQATSALITSSETLNSTSSLNNYTLASPLAVNSGDKLEIEWTIPNYAITPTNVIQQFNLKIEY